MRKATLVSLTLALAIAAVGIARIQTPAAAAGVGTQASPPPDLPLDQIKMAPGFKIELFATGVTNAREMALGSKGTVFVGSRNKPAGDTVYAVVDQNGDYKADQVIPIAKGLNEPSGVAFRDGSALRRRDPPRREVRQHRVEAPVAGRAGRGERHAAERHASRAEVHRLRTGRSALRACRRPMQRLRQGKGRSALRDDSSHEARWLGARGVRQRRAQLGRLRLASADPRAVVHRQRQGQHG